MADMADWNTSCAEHMPKGSLVNMNLPKGVLNVHNFELTSSSLICQYPELASRTVNSLAPGMRDAISFNCCCWEVLSLDGLVQISWVDANSYLAVGFGDCYHAIDPFRWSLGSLDYSETLHSPKLFFDFFSECCRYSTRRVDYRFAGRVCCYVMSNPLDAA